MSGQSKPATRGHFKIGQFEKHEYIRQGELTGVPSASAILNRFLQHAQTIAITGRSYRLKDQAAASEKEQKHNKVKSNEPSTAGSAS